MASWCSRFGHHMNAKEVINNFDEIIIKRNKDIYDAFLAKIRYDNSRNKR